MEPLELHHLENLDITIKIVGPKFWFNSKTQAVNSVSETFWLMQDFHLLLLEVSD
jgi:hypothetical protein